MATYEWMKETRYDVAAEGAKEKILDWISTGRKVTIWKSINLSNMGSGPIFTPGDANKPSWDVIPIETVDDPSRFRFAVGMQEIKRFHVGVRRGSQGLSLKVTEGGTRRIYRELDKVGPDARYCFDYSTQRAIILKPMWEA